MDVMAEIGAAVELGHAGGVEEARRRLAELWADPVVQEDPFHRCTLAHYAADLEPETADELRWDLRALAAADEVTDERARAHHASLSIAGFYPSLYLNLGDDYRRLGDLDAARRYLDLGRGALSELPDDEYGGLIRHGFEVLAERLGVGS
ncbi:hypothetical protein [Actinomycetospora atypica]|uniref:Tetratricopeptide repeat protein n=1 Tax=Actinomycetospora atypica TaxID=1290095 RepID=A0ABV9YES4_9PSEU